MVTWTTTDLLDVTRFQSKLHKVTISSEGKVDLISWLSPQHRRMATFVLYSLSKLTMRL